MSNVMVFSHDNRRTPSTTLFPYTTLFRSDRGFLAAAGPRTAQGNPLPVGARSGAGMITKLIERLKHVARRFVPRSEEHTSELQSHVNLVCRLLLEKKKQFDREPTPEHLAK